MSLPVSPTIAKSLIAGTLNVFLTCWWICFFSIQDFRMCFIEIIYVFFHRQLFFPLSLIKVDILLYLLIFHSVSVSDLISFLVFDDCVWIRPSGAFSYIFLLFSLAHCHSLSGPLGHRLKCWQTMPMNDEWWLEVCLVPAECIIQHRYSNRSPPQQKHGAVSVSHYWKICPKQDSRTTQSGNQPQCWMLFWVGVLNEAALQRVFWWVLKWSCQDKNNNPNRFFVNLVIYANIFVLISV